MTWWKKLFGIPEVNDELYKSKESKQEKTLEQWRSEIENRYLKIHDSKVNESPYITYFFNHCQYCNEFCPASCFDKKGNLHVKAFLICSKLRLNMKKLNERK